MSKELISFILAMVISVGAVVILGSVVYKEFGKKGLIGYLLVAALIFYFTVTGG